MLLTLSGPQRVERCGVYDLFDLHIVASVAMQIVDFVEDLCGERVSGVFDAAD